MMTAATVERQLAEMLADEALIRAPEGALATVLGRVEDLPQRRRPFVSLGPNRLQLQGRRRLLLGLVAAVLAIGIAIAGAILLPPPDPIQGSSLVILEHQPFVEGGPPLPVTVLAIGPDGTRRTIMTIQPDQLDGRYAESYGDVSVDGYLVVPVSTPGGVSFAAVLDLRDPSAQALLPDAEGAIAKFGPDGRLAMSQNDGSYAIFDPVHATTAWMRPSGGGNLVQRDSGLVWTVDGGFVAARGGVEPGRDPVRVDASGRQTDAFPHAYYAGVGARRVDAAGRLLRCHRDFDDDLCEGSTSLYAVGPTGSSEVWTQSTAARRVIDFAWAVDGGVWLLTESIASGPRNVELHRVKVGVGDTVIAAFTGEPDDPDPDSYSRAARLAAFSSDDRRVVVELTGQPVAELWSVDTRSRRSTKLPGGVVAGWLDAATLTKPRPPVERMAELPGQLRGAWAHDEVGLDFDRRTLTLRLGISARPPVLVRSDRPGELVLTGAFTLPRCGSGATYGWSVDPEGLRLSSLDESCPERAALLQRSFERALGHPDTGSVPTEPGVSYVASEFGHRFRVVMPSAASTLVGSNQPEWITLFPTAGDATVTFLVPQAGPTDPCDATSHGRIRVDGEAGVAAYIQTLTTVRVRSAEAVGVGHEIVPTVRVEPVDVARCPELDLFWLGERFGYYNVADGTRMAVVERDGPDVVILISVGSASPGTDAWIRDLLTSVEWLP